MVCMHCEDPTCAAGLPRRRHQADRGGHRAVGAQAPVHRLLELRDRLPVRRPEVRRRVRPDDEVRHVHRPHVGGLRADVRLGVPERGPLVRHARGVPRHPPAARSSTTGSSAARACAPRCSPSSTTLAAARSTCSTDAPAPGSTTPSAWREALIERRGPTSRAAADLEARLPLRGRRRGGRHPPRVRPLPRRRRRGDGRRQPRPRGLDPAAHHQHRRTPGDRRRSTTSRVGDTYLFRYPTDDDPAILLRLGDAEVVAFSQKCTHLGCVVYFEAEERPVALPVPRGQLRGRAPARSSPGPPPAARAASTSRSATTAPSGRWGTSLRTSRARPGALLRGRRST